jgi:hypothetical protein
MYGDSRNPGGRACAWLSCLLLALMLTAPGMVLARDQDSPARLLYVVVEPDRIAASNILFSRTDEFDLAAREEILEQRTGNAVAAFLTNQRILGYSVYTASWMPMPLKAGEIVEQFEAEDYSAFVLTSKRILNFNGRIGHWSVTRR